MLEPEADRALAPGGQIRSFERAYLSAGQHLKFCERQIKELRLFRFKVLTNKERYGIISLWAERNSPSHPKYEELFSDLQIKFS